MKKLIYIVILIAGCFSTVLAQQSPQFTQYMFNDFVLNPAVAGTYDYYQIRSNHRFQWVGITDPPMTNTLSFYGPSGKLPMGFGAYFYNDVTGPTSRTGLTGAYAYNIEINKDMRISGGLSLGLMQYKLDGTQLNPKDLSDLAIQPVVNSSYVPDASIGFYLYAKDYYGGISVSQLFNNKLKIYEVKSGLNKLKSHVYLTGGYKYKIDRDFTVEPSAIIKITAPKTFQFDITGRVIYQDTFWGGLSFRMNDAVSVLLGYNYDNKFSFGYAYDMGVNGLRKFNSGSHELMIGYRFNDIK
ncbi:MAG: type IX secretion system membrane protein PorP/SprF [Bacteroidales bacterium]|nr:type IX secretion system membrane protein PorP/SprF [Bacteroidales bacterium]MCB9014085.1 type IX secretion system membrane protein PorP/SprF [Bacteroidales bacterium]